MKQQQEVKLCRDCKLLEAEKMTNQDKVRSRYPHASAEQESTGEWGVWDISHDERKWLIGLGMAEAEAWADAVQKIERREGRRLPMPNPHLQENEP